MKVHIQLLVLCSLLLLRIASSNAATLSASPLSCRILAATPAVSVESCESGIAQKRWMKLVVSSVSGSAQSNKTTINALFAGNQKIWDRVWISEGNGRLNANVQKTLQEWVAQPSADLKSSGFVPLLDVLGNFLEPDTSIENFDRPISALRNWDQNFFGTWTPICESIGLVRTARYFLTGDNSGVEQTIDLPVGEPATSCRGRCGWGCAQAGLQIRHNQYTQECFNHDACHWTHHIQFGVCADAFWAAAASYVFAPECPALPI